MSKAEIGSLGGVGTAGTLIGAGVGAGFGYITGNEMDKKEVQNRNQAIAQETWPLAETACAVASVSPPPPKDIKGKSGGFKPDGTLTTTTTYWDGRTEADSERYRIVGRTLIINQND